MDVQVNPKQMPWKNAFPIALAMKNIPGKPLGIAGKSSDFSPFGVDN
jgi:hypothetical protein